MRSDSYENALRIYTEKDFPQDRVTMLFNLAVAYDDFLKDWQKAYETCDEAIKVLETRVRAVSSAETRRAVAEFYGGRIYAKIVSLCIRLGKTEDALSYAERGKSRTLVEMLHSAQLMPSEKTPEDIRNAFLALRKKLEQLLYMQELGEKAVPRDFEIEIPPSDTEGFSERRFVFRTVPVKESSPRGNIFEIREEAQKGYDYLLKEIRRLDPEFAASERVQPISVAEIQAMVPEKTVFVECFTGGDGTYIFVLDGKSGVSENYLVLKDLTTAELFNNLATENWLTPYYAYRNDRTPENRQAWHNAIENTPKLLAEKFWYAKDEKGISLAALVETSGAERIVFMPHSGLHLLPLHLIPLTAGKEQRLMDKYEISYSPSASMLRFVLNREALPLNSLFAVANPTNDLFFTDAEVRGIAGHFTQPDILWYENAAKDTVLKNAGSASAVHFSCHGSFQVDKPLDSMLILAGGKSDKTKNLSLKDIFANLKLSQGATVTLSACETGMVKLERGDEYVGLPSGFLHSGASSVISSLWAVDDLSTGLLMQKFYANVIKDKMGKAAAIREAQQYVRHLTVKEIRETAEKLEAEKSEDYMYRSLAKKHKAEKKADEEKPFARPYYWGAFVCSGNWM